MSERKTATVLKDNLKGYVGYAALYRLSPPLDGHELVVVSSVHTTFDTRMPETFIFPADKKGNVTDWYQLKGSEMGTTSHENVLGNIGYVIIREEAKNK